MAQIAVLESPQTAVAVLGSCIGLAIFDARAGLAALAHIVLPTREGREGPAGKFVDSAIPDMIATLLKLGADRGKLKAKAAGGASMFNSTGPI